MASMIDRENKANKTVHMKFSETKEIEDTHNSKANTNNSNNNNNNNKNKSHNKDKDKKTRINNNNSNMIHQKMNSSNNVLIVHIPMKVYNIQRKINIKILIEDFFCRFWILGFICLFFCGFCWIIVHI